MRNALWLWFSLGIPFLICSQSGNESLRHLNDIVRMMDEASRLNRTWYYDAVQLAEGLHQSRQKINPNYFYSSQSTHSGTVYYTDMEKAFRFKELKPDASSRLPSYMADLIPWLEAKEQVASILQKPHHSISLIDQAVLQYISNTDSLYAHHSQLGEYIAKKRYLGDPKFAEAKAILKQQEHWFEACHEASIRLTETLQTLAAEAFPPNRAHADLMPALREMQQTTGLLDTWEKSLREGNEKLNQSYDRQLRQLNKNALEKDSIYLYGTRGYGLKSSGWWPHSRYRSFYSMLQSTVYWYATARYSNTPYLKPELVRYNQFINGYDTGMEYYNRFLELFDGKTMLVQSSCCLSASQIDTAQNVMLYKPRLLYRFAYVDMDEMIKDPPQQETGAALSDAGRIRRALPHHLIYLLDASSSMNEPERLPALKSQVKYLVDLQRASDRISIIGFASHAQVLMANQPCTQKTDLYKKIDQINAIGSTNISDGIRKACLLADSCRLKEGITRILLFTDGAFSLGKADKKLLKSLLAKQIGFGLIYLGHARGSVEEELKKLCEKVDGRYYNATDTGLREVLLKEASE